MKYQAGRYHVLTWCYSSGEDSKGDFSTKARALQEMLLAVEISMAVHCSTATVERRRKSILRRAGMI